MMRLSLYMIGAYGLVAAAMVYASRRSDAKRMRVVKMADQLRDAWADYHTQA